MDRPRTLDAPEAALTAVGAIDSDGPACESRGSDRGAILREVPLLEGGPAAMLERLAPGARRLVDVPAGLPDGILA